MRLLDEKEELKVVSDQVGCPTWVDQLGLTLVNFVAENKFIPGIYHYCDKGETSWFDFACKIKEYSNQMGLLSKPVNIIPVDSSYYETSAKRPLYSVLNTDKIANTFNVVLSKWQDNLLLFIRQLHNSD